LLSGRGSWSGRIGHYDLTAGGDGGTEFLLASLFCDIRSIYGPHAFFVWAFWFFIHGGRKYFSMPRASANNVLPYQALCIVCISYMQFKSTSMNASILPISSKRFPQVSISPVEKAFILPYPATLAHFACHLLSFLLPLRLRHFYASLSLFWRPCRRIFPGQRGKCGEEAQRAIDLPDLMYLHSYSCKFCTLREVRFTVSVKKTFLSPALFL
jgi:hypothetical protein